MASHVLTIALVPAFELRFVIVFNKIDLIFDFDNLRNCSTGANTGEYSGKKKILIPMFSIVSFVIEEVW